MCVDSWLLDPDKAGLKDNLRKSVFDFVEPADIGYVPAVLSFVCSKCELIKTFANLAAFNKYQSELNTCKCSDEVGTQNGNKWISYLFIRMEITASRNLGCGSMTIIPGLNTRQRTVVDAVVTTHAWTTALHRSARDFTIVLVAEWLVTRGGCKMILSI